MLHAESFRCFVSAHSADAFFLLLALLLLVLHIAQDDLFMSGAESLPRICLGQSDKKTQQGDGHWHLVKLPSTEHITHVAVGASHSLAVTGTVLLE